MARFDVYSVPGDLGFLLDCQANVLSRLDTRFVVPLLPRSFSPPVFPGLNPIFTVEGEQVIMLTQSASAIPARLLVRPIMSLADQHYVISNALDMLLTGY